MNFFGFKAVTTNPTQPETSVTDTQLRATERGVEFEIRTIGQVVVLRMTQEAAEGFIERIHGAIEAHQFMASKVGK